MILFSGVIKINIYITRFEEITTSGGIESYVVSPVGRNLSIGVIPNSQQVDIIKFIMLTDHASSSILDISSSRSRSEM